MHVLAMFFFFNVTILYVFSSYINWATKALIITNVLARTYIAVLYGHLCNNAVYICITQQTSIYNFIHVACV